MSSKPVPKADTGEDAVILMTPAQSKRIEELYFEMFEMLMAYARSILDSEALAEEAVQETFRIACQKPADVCQSVNPQGWLVQTLKYTIRNITSNRATAKKFLEQYIRSQGQEAAAAEDRLNPGVLYENIADTEEYKLLTEMAVEGRSILEMATSRGISVAACKKRVQRAKETLRKKVKL